MQRQGYAPQVYQTDATKFDFSKVAPIDLMLLDVDLYGTTHQVLEHVLPHLNKKAFIVVDDCAENQIYDGANQAYEEFCMKQGMPPRRFKNVGLLAFGG